MLCQPWGLQLQGCPHSTPGQAFPQSLPPTSIYPTLVNPLHSPVLPPFPLLYPLLHPFPAEYQQFLIFQLRSTVCVNIWLEYLRIGVCKAVCPTV